MLAHRGFAVSAPENTLAAFAAALELGVTHLETDVQVTRDNIAVLIHDRDLRRVAGRRERVWDLSLAELRRIDLGDGQRVPTLDEALAAFPTACFNIDVKAAGAIAAVVVAVRGADATARVLITSFSESRRRRAVNLLPGVATSASAPRVVAILVAVKIGWPALTRWSLRGIDAVQVPERYYGIRVTTGRMIRRLQEAGVEIHVWTINDTASMKRLLALGVDGLVTDRSDLAMDVTASP